jgi:hypothetical protein
VITGEEEAAVRKNIDGGELRRKQGRELHVWLTRAMRKATCSRGTQ